MPLGTAFANNEQQLSRGSIPVHGWVSGDGHSHTTYSWDAENTPAEMIDAAKKEGMNYLIITDHNNSNAYANGDLAEHETNNMITTIWGQEYTKHSQGHVTIMSMTPIRNYSAQSNSDMESITDIRDMINEVHSAGGMVIAAHPYEGQVKAQTGTHMKVAGWEEFPWDMVEVWNGWYGPRHESTIYSFAYWDRQNRKNIESTMAGTPKQRIYGVAQSDSHDNKYFGQTAYSKAYVNQLTAQDIFNAYKKGNVYGTNGPTLSFTVNGQMMGSDVVLDPDDLGNVDITNPSPFMATRAANTTKVTVKISGQYEKGLKRAILIHNKHRDGDSGYTGPDGKPSYSYSKEFNLSGVTSFEREFTVDVAPGDFLRLELEGNDGSNFTGYRPDHSGFAFSNPIFITANTRTNSELTDLINDANQLRNNSTTSYAYTHYAVNGLNSAINDAMAIRNQMGSSAENRPTNAQVNQAYNRLQKVMDDFSFLPKPPKTPNTWYQDPATGNIYRVGNDGFLLNSMQDVDGGRYYFSEQIGAAQLRWQQVGGKWYYFSPTGNPGEKGRAYEGFRDIGTKSYYFYGAPDYSMAEGHSNINGNWYYFNGSGAMQKGWLKEGTDSAPIWYFFNKDTGIAVIGWHYENGQEYYFNPANRQMVTGMQVIDGKRYVFNKDGQKLMNGWQQANEGIFYLQNGESVTGWNKIGSSWYFFNGSGIMQTGWVKDAGKWYYLDAKSGNMQTGWLEDGKTASGAPRWYFLKADGSMATGWAGVNNRWYYMNGSGTMQTGWVKDGGSWYYMMGSGAMATGWVDDAGKWYYMNPASGAMFTQGTHNIGGRNYTLLADGSWNGK